MGIKANANSRPSSWHGDEQMGGRWSGNLTHENMCFGHRLSVLVELAIY